MRIHILLFLSLFAFNAQGQLSIALEEYASGFNTIVKIASNGIDDRLYVVERKGVVKIIQEDGTTLETPFLDINDRVFNASGQSERGLLGLAFHPDFSDNGYFFVNYTDNNGDTQITRFHSDAAGNIADPDSEDFVMTISQPYSNHNGGDLAFGPDGYLYIGTGDGGSGNDPDHNGQNRQSLLGKMLRIDVDQLPYRVPSDNPFVEDDETLDEIWALGLRNPWRYSFDQETGDLWIADVGQFSIEEINFQAAGSTGGQNYGWRCYEGTTINTDVTQEDCIAYEETTPPFYEYNHSPENHCSITGGYVYRGCTYPELHGYYLYADVCTGYIWGVKREEDGQVENIKLGIQPGNWTTFGEATSGQLYVAGLYEGIVYRITSDVEVDDIQIEGVDGYLYAINGGFSMEEATGFMYQWYLFDELIEGADQYGFEPLEEGEYYLKVTHESGCFYITETTYFYTSTEDFDAPKVTFSPNPFDDYITIDLSEVHEAVIDIKLIDINGKIVISQETVTPIDNYTVTSLCNLPSGVYIIQIETDGGKIVEKVVKR